MIRKTIDGMEYRGTAHNFYWNPAVNPEANVENGLPNCTEAAYGLVLEGGLLPPVSKITDASRWHEFLINGWIAQPYETYKENIKVGDILEWTTGNHVAVISDVSGAVKVSASFYTGIHGKAYYNGKYDTRNGIATLQQLNDFFINKYQYRFFHCVDLETENEWCGAEPTYVLVAPSTIIPEERNKYTDQIYIGINGLRLRSEPNTGSRVNGTAPVGYFNAEKINGEEWEDRGLKGNTWYKIKGYYVAAVDGVEYYPKEQESAIIQIEKIMNELAEEIRTLKEENKDLKDRLERIKELC